MRYVSTRGGAPARDFEGVLLAGLAEDGGLFVPESWPQFTPADWRALRGLPYAELAARVTERCFYSLEAPVLRVTGYDVPYPASRLEEHFLPDLDRVLDAVDRVTAY